MQPEVDLYPEHLRENIDELNEWTYPKVHDGAASWLIRKTFKQAAYPVCRGFLSQMASSVSPSCCRSTMECTAPALRRARKRMRPPSSEARGALFLQ